MRWAFVLLAPLCASACVGVIGDGSPFSNSNTSSGPVEPASVDGQVVISPQIVRLTNLAYANSVRDLFPGVAIPPLTFPAPSSVVVYDNNALAQAPTPALIESYQANARAIAAAAVGNLATVLPSCAAAPNDACAMTYLADLAGRAYRHPLRDDEKSRLTTTWQSLRAANEVPTALGAMIEGILQTPAFLYQIEEGTPVDGQPALARLTGNELATRLATLLWATLPDAALRAVADDDRLLLDGELEAQARRLMNDPRAHDSVARMQYQWLRFGLMEKMKKDAVLFPSWSDATATAMRNATERFVDHVFWEEGTFASLFTDSHTFVNTLVAPYYGLPPAGGSGLLMVNAPTAQRAGLLTQVGLLGAFAHEAAESPVLRGVFVLDRILCAPSPPPPPNVNNSPPTSTGGDVTTTRDRFVTLHENGACAACHTRIDGVGFGFEHYDAVGKWRDIEGGKPVDATGKLVGAGDIDGPFDGAGELSSKLAKSQRASFCITKNWLQYALGIDPSAASEDLVKPVQAALGATPLFKDLLLAIIKSAAFRYRVVTP